MTYQNESSETESKIVESFSKHAKGYDKHAHLQKTMAERLATLLPESLPDRILELGCGTGVFTRHLLTRPVRHLILNDISPLMVKQLVGRMELPEDHEIVLGNAETVHFDTVDLIVANAVFQWFHHPEQTLTHLKNSLAPDGKLIFSTFGPGTLKEFRETASIPCPAHLNSLDQWKKMILGAELKVDVSDAELRRTFAPSSLSLMKNLQQIGAAPLKLTGPGGLRRVFRDYDSLFRTDQGVYASWELYYFSVSN